MATEHPIPPPAVAPSVARRPTWLTILDLGAILAMVMASAVIIWNNWPRSGRKSAELFIPSAPVSIDGAPIIGSRSARLAIIEFADFQCPYCATFVRDTLPELDKRYIKAGNVFMAFRHLPLESIHPLARKAAEAAECASRYGRFREMHDVLFANPKQLGLPDLRGHAQQIGIEELGFGRCLAGEASARISADVALAKDLKISSTPTFLLGTVQRDGLVKAERRIAGASSFANFQAILDQLDKRRREGRVTSRQH